MLHIKGRVVSRISIDDIAKLFGMTQEEVLGRLQDNRIVVNSARDRLLGYRFSGGSLESIGKALRSASSRTGLVSEIEIADIEKVTDLPHSTVCEAFGLPVNAGTFSVAEFHEGVEAVAQLRGSRQRTSEIKWQNETKHARDERDAARAEAAERGMRLHQLETALKTERANTRGEKKRADSLEKTLAAAYADIDKMDNEIGEKERSIDCLRDQLATLRGKLILSQAKLSECQGEVERSQAELLEQASRLDKMSQRASELEAQLEQSRQSQSSQQPRDELNALQVRTIEFWNRWLDADETACKSAAYNVKALAQTLAKRQETAYKTLFGAGIPSYDQLREDTDLLNLMKQLGFGNDIHPDGYANPSVIAYYTLRYELGYAFEYYEIYRGVLETLVDGCDASVLSMGCGQGLDYWGLRCAQAALNRQDISIRWHGVDLETWPEPVLHDDTTFYEYDTDLLDLIARDDALGSTVVMLPKIISELPMSVVERLAEWLERVEFIKPVHYLCIAHTEMNKLGGLFEFDANGFDQADAVKSAKLIDAFTRGARRQGYVIQGPVCPSVADSCEIVNAPRLVLRQYRVKWDHGTTPIAYKFAAYESSSSSRSVTVSGVKPFDTEAQVGRYVHDIGKMCCGVNYALDSKGYCVSRGKRDDCPRQCPLYKRPRSRTDGMAYQIYRVERPKPKHYASSAPKAPESASHLNIDDDIPF